MDINRNAENFYKLLQKEERALIALDLDMLNNIRKEKSKYLNWFESLLKDSENLKNLDADILKKIRKKNLTLANLYKFSLSLFKKENSYGKTDISSLSIKA